MKLLGLTLDKNLTFKSFTKESRRKGFYAIWKLKRLHATGVCREDIKKVYLAYIRSTLEYGLMPTYNDAQKQSIEAVQRRATKSILGIKKLYGDDVMPYESRLEELGIESLSVRMQGRMDKFSQKSSVQRWCEDDIQEKLMTDTGQRRKTSTRPFIAPRCNTTRRQNGPVQQMIVSLNKQAMS